MHAGGRNRSGQHAGGRGSLAEKQIDDRQVRDERHPFRKHLIIGLRREVGIGARQPGACARCNGGSPPPRAHARHNARYARPADRRAAVRARATGAPRSDRPENRAASGKRRRTAPRNSRNRASDGRPTRAPENADAATSSCGRSGCPGPGRARPRAGTPGTTSVVGPAGRQNVAAVATALLLVVLVQVDLRPAAQQLRIVLHVSEIGSRKNHCTNRF